MSSRKSRSQLLRTAEQAVAQVPTPGWDSYGQLEDICVVDLANGEPGVEMRWQQGEDSFGLLVSVRDLIEQSGALESVPFYLTLALDEPHGPVDGRRFWFSALPTALDSDPDMSG